MNNKKWSVSFYQRFKSDEEKFWEKVDKKGEDDCWEWQAARSRKGYGNFYISLGHSKDLHQLAHRYSWKLFHKQEIPIGMCVCHHCDNPPCVNPKHLFLGTNDDNMKDRVAKGRSGGKFGEESSNHKLTNEKVREVRRLLSIGIAAHAISKIFEVDPSTIYHIVDGKSWKGVE